MAVLVVYPEAYGNSMAWIFRVLEVSNIICITFFLLAFGFWCGCKVAHSAPDVPCKVCTPHVGRRITKSSPCYSNMWLCCVGILQRQDTSLALSFIAHVGFLLIYDAICQELPTKGWNTGNFEHARAIVNGKRLSLFVVFFPCDPRRIEQPSSQRAQRAGQQREWQWHLSVTSGCPLFAREWKWNYQIKTYVALPMICKLKLVFSSGKSLNSKMYGNKHLSFLVYRMG